MFKKLCYSLKNRKGFTLVELMVVVVIIGILAAIAVPVYNSSQAKVKATADTANVRILNGATTQWAMEEGKDLSKAATTCLITDLVPKYIQETPISPYAADPAVFANDYEWKAAVETAGSESSGQWASKH